MKSLISHRYSITEHVLLGFRHFDWYLFTHLQFIVDLNDLHLVMVIAKALVLRSIRPKFNEKIEGIVRIIWGIRINS